MKRIAVLILIACTFTISAEQVSQPLIMDVAFSARDITLDPLHSYRTDELQIATGIYEGLVSYHPETLRPIPGVAYKWTVSEDKKTYTFYLRERARFSNGDQVTAQDFRDSWLRIITPGDEGEYSFLFDIIKGVPEYRAGKTAESDSVGITAVSRTILKVELSQPAGHFLSMLPHMTFAPVHSQYRDTEGWGSGRPIISNGPFIIGSWDSDAIVLKRNPMYWDTWHVALDAINIRTVDDPRAIADLLNSGEVVWADYADTSLIENPRFVQVGPLFATSYLYFRADEEPWNDPLVRRGLAHLIPWDQLRANASAFTSRTLVPAVGFYDEPQGFDGPDIEEGLKLLKEAGFPNGRGLPEAVAITTPGSTAEAVLKEAAKIWKDRIGLSVRFVAVDFARYTEVAREGGYTFGSSTWIGDFADPLSFLQMWTTGSNLNDANFHNEEYDSLIDTAMAQEDKERFTTLGVAEELLLFGEAIVIPLMNPPSFNLVDLDTVSGWFSNALDIHPFKYIGYRKSKVPDLYVMLP